MILPDNKIPQYQSGNINPSQGNYGDEFTVKSAWQDPDGDEITSVKARYKLQDTTEWTEITLDPVPDSSPPEFSKTITISGDPGTYEVQFQASDANGTSEWVGSETFTITEVLADPPIISVVPESIDYGRIKEGTQLTKFLNISNSGTGDLAITGMTLSDDQNFILDVNPNISQCGTQTPVIPPNRSCKVMLIFKPKSNGEYSETFTITSNDPENSTVTVPLTAVSSAPEVKLSISDGVTLNSFEFTAEIFGLTAKKLEWYIDEDDIPDSITADNSLLYFFRKDGDYNIRVKIEAVGGTLYEAQIPLTVQLPKIEEMDISFEPVMPLADSIPSQVMKGGMAYRHYYVYGEDGVPVRNRKIFYKLADQELTENFIDDRGIVEIASPPVNSDTEFTLIVTDETGEPVTTKVENVPNFQVQVTEREFTEEYKILIGLGGKIGKGLGIKLGPLEAQAVSAGISAGRNVSNVVTLNNAGNKTDVQIDSIMGNRIGAEFKAGKIEFMKKWLGKVGSPEIGVDAGLEGAFSWGAKYGFDEFLNNIRPDHDFQVLASAALFFQNIVNASLMASPNPVMEIVFNAVMEQIDDPVDFYEEGGDFSFSIKGYGSAKAAWSFEKIPVIGDKFGLDISAFEGEYVYGLNMSEDNNGVKKTSQNISYEADFLNLSPGINLGKKDNEIGVGGFMGITPFNFEGNDTFSYQTGPDGSEKIQLKRLMDRTGDSFYFIGSHINEIYYSMSTDHPDALKYISRYSPLLRDMKARDYFSVFPGAYGDTFEAMKEIINGEVQTEITQKDIKMLPIEIDFEVALGLKLGFDFKLDMQSALAYTAQKSVIVPGAEYRLESYEKDQQITDNIRGIDDILKIYKDSISEIIFEIAETVGEIVIDTGEVVIAKTKETFAEGGALIKAGAGKVAEGSKLFISKIKSVRIFNLRSKTAREDTVTYSTKTIGDVFIINVQDENGELMSEFSKLELAIGYNEELLQAAGFSASDASDLKIYRWDGESGYFILVGGTVDEAEQKVTANITLPGQYLLGIDELNPEMLVDFRITDKTPTPTITFEIHDNLSGLDLNTFSFKIDDNELVNHENYQTHIDAFTGMFSYFVEEPLTTGEHTASVSLMDTTGNHMESNFTFSVNATAPVITHTPSTNAESGKPLTITTIVTDDEAVSGVFLHYRAKTDEMAYLIVQMIKNGDSDEYTAQIPAAYITSFGTRYFIKTVDQSGNETKTELADIIVNDITGPEITENLNISSDSGKITVSWLKPEDADLTGYKIYIGDTQENLTLYEDTGNILPWIKLDESKQGSFIEIVGYDASGNEGKRIGPMVVEPTACSAAAAFTASTNELTAAFSNNGSIGDMFFDYGDGTNGTALTHTYSNAGTYTVIMTATDTVNNCTDTATQTVTVSSAPYIPPLITCSASATVTAEPETGSLPLPVTFNTDGTTGSVFFNYGDGLTGTENTHTYTEPGTYTVSMTVTDNEGCTDTAQATITVNPACDASAKLAVQTEKGQAPLTIAFDTEGSEGTLSFDYGDTNTGTEANHTYTEPGTYTVILTAAGSEGCTDTAQAVITVEAPCTTAIAAFTASTSEGTAPLEVSFDTSASAGKTFVWNFGDGTTGTDSTPVHTYTEPGTYTVTLTVSAADGCENSASAEIIVTPSDALENFPPEQPVLTINAQGKPETGTFADADNDTLANVIWEVFTDRLTLFRQENGTAILTLPELFLNNSETYYCRAMFVDDKGNTSQWSEKIRIAVNELQTDTDGNGVPDGQEADAPASMFPDITQESVRFVSIYDNSTVIGAVAVEPGKNIHGIANLLSVDPANLSDTGKPVFLPSGLAGFKLNVEQGEIAEVKVHFSNTAPGWAKWYVFDELAEQYSEYAYAGFSEDGKSVTLEIQDGGFGDIDGIANGIIVFPASGYGIDEQCTLAAFTADPKSGDNPLTVKFDASASTGELSWDFGDNSEAGTGAGPEHVYNEPGTYIVTLTATGDNGCFHSSKLTIEVTSSDSDSSSNCFISASALKIRYEWAFVIFLIGVGALLCRKVKG